MIASANVRKSINYKDFITQNVHPHRDLLTSFAHPLSLPGGPKTSHRDFGIN